MNERIFIALDVSNREEALRLVDTLYPLAPMFKIGLQLYTAEGPRVVREVIDRGAGVFLDLKFHDIPNTVKSAALEAAKLGVSMMTLHAAGGDSMMRAVKSELQDKFGDSRPLIVAVTVLTSMDTEALKQTGIDAPVDRHVVRMAQYADAAGLDGVVCSPLEIASVRAWVRPGFRIVTPGVRMEGQPVDDQRRTATPGEALALGADYLVVGRPVTRALDPRAAFEQLVQSL